MNVFELAAFGTPLAGAIAAGASVRTHSTTSSGLAIGLGLVIGLVVCFAAMWFSGLMSRVPGVETKTEGLSPLQWLASMAGVLAPALSPVATVALSTFVIGRILPL